MLHTPHRDTGSSRYCGPTAIMCVTGERGSHVARLVREVKGPGMNATGMSTESLLAVMARLGWQPVETWKRPMGEAAQIVDPKGKWFRADGTRFRWAPRYRFAQFLAEHGHRGPFIVCTGNHYMAVSHGEVCDAASTILPTDVATYLNRGKFGYRQSWVEAWWLFAPCNIS